MTTSTWNHLEGVPVNGQFVVDEWLSESGGATFFRTIRGPACDPALLEVIPLSNFISREAAGAQLDLWRATTLLSHPNLLCLLDCGQVDEGPEPFLYAAFEYPDDSLDDALAHGPLSEAETRQVLGSAIPALRFLHSRGMVCSTLTPRHVVAVGESIKLLPDTLREVSYEATPAGDVRALGSLAYQLLTGHPASADATADLSSISEPFRRIIQHSLLYDPSWRWTIDEIAAALNPPAHGPVSSRASHANRPGSFPRWILIATPLLLALIVLLSRGRSAAPDAALEVPPRPAVVQPAIAPSTPQLQAHAASRAPWRVVVFTYTRKPDADKRVRIVNQKWTGARAEVFTPAAGKGPYLVTVGGWMSREQAVKFLKVARGKAMPRSSYLQNYTAR